MWVEKMLLHFYVVYLYIIFKCSGHPKRNVHTFTIIIVENKTRSYNYTLGQP